MKKTIWALMSAMIITAMIFASCAAGTGGDPEAEGVIAGTSENASVSETVTEPATELTTESTTEATTKPTTESTTKETSTAKPTTEATTKETTTAKPTTQASTKETTTKKETTTQKPTTTTTTKPATTTTTTTQKNVTPKEVQDQVNAYIKSKGFIFDSTLTPSTAGWNVPTARDQVDLNNGYTLRTCKYQVDLIASESDPSRTAAYCYFDNDSFYVLYI